MPSYTNSMSDYLENKVLDHWLLGNSWTSPSKVYLALGTHMADDDDVDNWPDELSGNGYQRQEISFAPPRSDQNRVTFCENDAEIQFTSTGSWGTITAFTIWDQETGGKMLYRSVPVLPYTVDGSGQTFTVEKRKLRVQFDQGEAYSEYLQKKLLNHILRNVTFSPPTIYAALAYFMADFTDSGADLSEPDSSLGYGRVQYSNWVLNDNLAYHGSEIEFPEATADYPDRTRCFALCDSSGINTGNLLAYTAFVRAVGQIGGDPPGPELILEGDIPTITDSELLRLELSVF